MSESEIPFDVRARDDASEVFDRVREHVRTLYHPNLPGRSFTVPANLPQHWEMHGWQDTPPDEPAAPADGPEAAGDVPTEHENEEF